MNNLPIFFNYKEENADSGYETIQDMFLSWTLRCSEESKENSEYPNLNEYSKRILLNLIFDEKIPENILIKSVKTKRQWKLIDLLVEVKIQIEGEIKEYILNIENKWYTSVRSGQLEKSQEAIINKYSNEKYNLINLIIMPDSEKLDNNIKSISEKLNYKIKIIEEIKEETNMLNQTGNYLFDEYWFKFY